MLDGPSSVASDETIVPETRRFVQSAGSPDIAIRWAGEAESYPVLPAQLSECFWSGTPSVRLRTPTLDEGRKAANFSGSGVGGLGVEIRQKGPGCQLLGVGSWRPAGQKLSARVPSRKCHKGATDHSAVFACGFRSFRYGGGQHSRNIEPDLTFVDFGPQNQQKPAPIAGQFATIAAT